MKASGAFKFSVGPNFLLITDGMPLHTVSPTGDPPNFLLITDGSPRYTQFRLQETRPTFS